MNCIQLVLVFCLFFASSALGLRADAAVLPEDQTGEGGLIINRYLQATQSDSQKTSQMAVEIEASVPNLNEHGHLKALRKISEVGIITYRVLGFEGDSSVKNQVIARYLEAEQHGQNDKSMTLTPANYKFRLRSHRVIGTAEDVYIFQVSPRKKRIGLFKGELWLDAKTCLPVLEKGRLVKNPSVFFRQVDFERQFAIQNGVAVPERMSSIIDTRLVGKVNLSVAYSSPAASNAEEPVVEESSVNPITK